MSEGAAPSTGEAMDPLERCSCGGRRWVDDEGWTYYPFGRPPARERTEHDGLLPCGFCNDTDAPQFSCPVCDGAPPPPDDIMCAACRADLTARSDEITDPVEVVLAAHRRVEFLSDLDKQECGCGWKVEGGPALHRRHVAAYVYVALSLDGPSPWVIGPASSMREAMEAAGKVDSDAAEEGNGG